MKKSRPDQYKTSSGPLRYEQLVKLPRLPNQSREFTELPIALTGSLTPQVRRYNFPVSKLRWHLRAMSSKILSRHPRKLFDELEDQQLRFYSTTIL